MTLLTPRFDPPRGTLPVLQYCTPAQLQVDRGYQRDLDAVSVRLITRIARNGASGSGLVG